jgi:hypothetical protein
LDKFKHTKMSFDSIEDVRGRLILIFRLLHLHRSIDLARARRIKSQVEKFQGNGWQASSHGQKGASRSPLPHHVTSENRTSTDVSPLFIALQRKGEKDLHWERVLDLKCPHISPRFLLERYVSLTKHHGTPGGPLLLSLHPPYKPLCSNSIGRITKNLLHQFGVNTNVFGPHSTRGAGVHMYKKLGLSSEHVAEIGHWKNLEAFSKHYLRLGVVDIAKKGPRGGGLVHNVSPGRSAESDRSRTPETEWDMGGSDREDEAQSTGEPSPPPRKGKKRNRSPQSTSAGPTPPSRLVFRFAPVSQPLSGSSSKKDHDGQNT